MYLNVNKPSPQRYRSKQQVLDNSDILPLENDPYSDTLPLISAELNPSDSLLVSQPPLPNDDDGFFAEGSLENLVSDDGRIPSYSSPSNNDNGYESFPLYDVDSPILESDLASLNVRSQQRIGSDTNSNLRDPSPHILSNGNFPQRDNQFLNYFTRNELYRNSAYDDSQIDRRNSLYDRERPPFK